MNQEKSRPYYERYNGLLLLMAFLLSLSNSMSAGGEQVITMKVVPEESNFICCKFEKPKITLRVNNLFNRRKDIIASYEVLDSLGHAVYSKQHAFHLLPNEAREVSIMPKISQSGYYDVKLKLKCGETFSQEIYSSLVVLSGGKELSKDSPFGIYTISSDGIVQDIIPKGYLRYLRKSGAQWGTFTFYWFLVQPTRDRWDWTVYDRRFANLKEAGLQPLPHLFGTPTWVSCYEKGMPSGGDGATHCVYPPKDLSAWGRFVYRVVNRYRDDLTYLRIWNEFDTQYWMGSIKEFADLLKVAYREAHRAKTDIKIVIDTSFAKMCLYEMLYKYGAGDCFDVISIHNYQFDKCLAPEETMFEQNYAAVLAWRDKRRPGCPVWDTEFGWYSEQSWIDPNWLGNGELAQAQYLVRAYILGLAMGISRMIWFPAYSYGIDVNGKHYVENAGLLRENMSPKPAYAAYHTISTLLHNANFNRKLDTNSPTQYAYEFQAGSKYITVLWNTSGDPEWITLRADGKLQRITMLGSESTIDTDEGIVSIELTSSPLYLVSSNKLTTESRVLALPDLRIDLTQGDRNPTNPVAPITLRVSNRSAKSRNLCVNFDNIPTEFGRDIELEMSPGQSISSNGVLIVPSANSTGRYQTRITLRDKGGPQYRFPMSIECKKSEKSLWRARTGDTPVSYHHVLSEPRYIEAILITFPAGIAYQFDVEVLRNSKDNHSEWITVFPKAIGEGTQHIEIKSEIRELRVTFHQILHFAGAEDTKSLVTREDLRKMGTSNLSRRWEVFRDHVTIKEGCSHTGNSCFEISNTSRLQVEPNSGIEQIVSVKGNSYYTFTAYAMMPTDTAVEGWAGLYVIGIPTSVPHCFVVLPSMDGRWHKLHLTVKTKPGQDKLRVDCLMSHSGLVYFDDIMGIPGKVETDIPEIVSLDFL